MEIDVWTSSVATHASQNPDTGKWDVTVKREDGTERLFHVDHVVFALGLGAGKPHVPEIPGRVRAGVIMIRVALMGNIGRVQGTGAAFYSPSQREGP